MNIPISDDERTELCRRQAAKQRYLSGGGVTCPFCGSDNLICGESDSQDDAKHQGVVCGGCHKEWTDVYTLTDVRFEE